VNAKLPAMALLHGLGKRILTQKVYEVIRALVLPSLFGSRLPCRQIAANHRLKFFCLTKQQL
jgi:hypothetical protein